MIVSDRLLGREFDQLFELSECFFRLIRLLVIDAEVEPGVRKRGIQALHLFEEGDAFGGSISVEESEGVVQIFADGVGREVDGLLEFGDGFDMRGRIFEEGLAQIAVVFDG